MKNKDNEPATIADLVATEAVSKESDNTYFISEEAANATQGELPSAAREVEISARLRSGNMLVAGSQLSQHFSDEYRRVKRPLLANAFGKSASLVKQGNLILVTSSLPGEGKTTTSTNLALSMAQEKDHTVLLVDCDINKQGVSRMLGLEDKTGLVEVLEDNSLNIGDVLLKTDVPGLAVLPAGKGGDFVTELLASQRMAELVSEMATRYNDRIIIFDGPPLLPTPQTQVLAELVGQVVFVIEAAKTPQMLVEEALEMLPEEKAVGLMMNKTEGMTSRGGYYYGYYGYGGE